MYLRLPYGMHECNIITLILSPLSIYISVYIKGFKSEVDASCMNFKIVVFMDSNAYNWVTSYRIGSPCAGRVLGTSHVNFGA